jgi:hypothetical protein
MQVDPVPKDLHLPSEFADLDGCKSCIPLDLAPPINTTLCKVVKDPQRFNGKVVRFRVEILPPSPDTPTRLNDRGCSTNVLLETDFPSLFRNVEYLGLLRSLTEKKGGSTQAVVIGTFERTSLEPNLHTAFDRVYLRSTSEVVSKPIRQPLNEKGGQSRSLETDGDGGVSGVEGIG